MDFRLLFLPLIIFALFGVDLWWYLEPEQIGWIMGTVGIISLTAAFWLNASRRDWWSFALAPTLLTWSALLYALVTSQTLITLVVLAVSFLASIIYWRLVFLYSFKHVAYRPFSLERVASYLSFLTVFFFGAALYGLKTFLNFSDWQLGMVFLAVILILCFQWAWFQKIEWRSGWRYGSTFALVLVEFFFIVGLLPLDFNVIGFILGSVWYLLSSLSGEHLAGRLSPERLRLIAGVVGGVCLLVLLTARWF